MVHLDKQVSSAAFYIYCRISKLRYKGSVAEWSPHADNYRAEILGGIMVQLVFRAATQGRLSVPYRSVVIECDSAGVVSHGNTPQRGLKEKQVHADALRYLKQHVSEYPVESNYTWIASHQDDEKEWSKLSLSERLNVVVDKLAKRALVDAIHHGDFISSAFPFKAICVEINHVKVTGSPRNSIAKHWGETTARQFYHNKHIINKYDFDLVWWDGSEKAMYDFPYV